ncbi:hypothetical protein C7447_101805 [Tenacibaculum adriaticum]|uniref:Uncharacterized protein n=1 Tax=Tenacibaculum adriaticum TaxID=413713 RepID=A0A5S5DWT5_9FLAO|nr:hypothetical protein [Tenacibaculum adriaticum]TYQ00195.1 hypothetical protein C7447_101805 [Tenacibaculum adriaticum]
MNKNTFLFIFCVLSAVSSINAQTTFDWDTPVITVDAAAGTVTQNKNGVKTTFYGVSNEVNASNGEGFGGSTRNVISSSTATFSSSVTFKFSKPVSVTSVLAIDATNFPKDWVFTPIGGSNSPVRASLKTLGGTSVDLNWTDVTEFTITSSLTDGKLGGDIFMLDNLVVRLN